MLGWVIRALMLLSGVIAGLFVARESLHFPVVQMVVAVILFTLGVILAAFWPTVKAWIVRIIKSSSK